MTILLQHSTPRIPAPALDRCSAGCDLGATILCWLRRRRELAADLAAAETGPDGEVLRHDLAAADRQIDRLIAAGRRAA